MPRALYATGDRLERHWGKLGREYKRIAFNKDCLKDDPTLEWVTPGHPLFECLRDRVWALTQEARQRGAVFFDLHREQPARLDVFSAAIQDGNSNVLHRRLFVVQVELDGGMILKQPTIFLDFALGEAVPVPEETGLPGRDRVEQFLVEAALQPFLREVEAQRQKETATIREHVEISLNTIINRVQCQFAELTMQKESGSEESGLDGRIRMLDDKLLDLNHRLEQRLSDLEKEQNCAIASIERLGRAWVLPHPERAAPEIAPMVANAEIEQIAVAAAIAYEEARGWRVQSVESENRGFDLISRLPHPEDPQTAMAVRFIEVKGRSSDGDVALTANEYKAAMRMGDDFWLYAVFNCATQPQLQVVQNPGRLGWEPVVKVEHYRLGAAALRAQSIEEVRG